MKGLAWFKAAGHIFATAGLKPAGRNQCTFSFIGIDVDEADVDAGEGLPTFGGHHGVWNDPFPLGQGSAVAAGEGAGDLDVADRVVVAVTHCENSQGARGESDP